MSKKVSIIIPVYNGANYMREAIDSALAQTYKNIEIIVVNDGSNDDGATREIALSYGDKIKYIEKENGGVSTALNLAIDNMTGDYFSWLSHDDLYYPTKVERQIEEIKKYDDHTILFSDFDLIDLEGKRFETCRYDHDLLTKKPDYALLRGMLGGISLLIPKEAFEVCGKFDEKLRCVQDYLKWFEFLDHYTFRHMPEVLTATRIHPNQVTNTSPKMVSEGNDLWTYMTEKYPTEKKIEYEGSEYEFYKEMENYLMSSPYKKAVENVHEMAEKCLEKAKKEQKDTKITVVVIDNGKQEDVEKTIRSLEKQKRKGKTILIEGSTKIGKVANTKNREESLKKIDTDYYTFLHAGVEAKEDWLEKQTLLATVTNKSVVVSDYPRPIRTGIANNLCSFMVPLDGVIFKGKIKSSYKTSYQYMFEMAKMGGSIIIEEKYLSNVVEDYKIEEVLDYQRQVLEDGTSTNYQLVTLGYDIATIYNKHSKEGKKVYMYEPCDEFREMKYSRTFQWYKKYYDFKQSKKKRI